MQSCDLLTILESRARETRVSRSPLYRFLVTGDVDGEQRTLTAAELLVQARAIATALRKTCAAGDRVVLPYASGLEFVAAFFGCLYASVIAVPVSHSALVRRRGGLGGLRSVVADCGAKVLLAPNAARE